MNRKMEAELQFVTAFGNSIMAEVSQISRSSATHAIDLRF